MLYFFFDNVNKSELLLYVKSEYVKEGAENKLLVKLFIVSPTVTEAITSSLVISLNNSYTSESLVILLLLPLIY